uniref:Labaditin n=1 Tax=Jatropha multifida TaxID=3996 RepID=LABA_JATMU|nr:RecName: Full=Labaditin [Jatropha multifida]
AGVWTVWGTI